MDGAEIAPHRDVEYCRPKAGRPNCTGAFDDNDRVRRNFAAEEAFDEPALVQLTAGIAMENFRSKFNVSFRVESNGLCPLPLPAAD